MAQQQTRIIVKDNGPGIPEAELQAVFSLFRSAKGNQGTGLGLPVSQKILREHGGDVLVESELGKGSCFVLQWALNPASTGGGGDTQAS